MAMAERAGGRIGQRLWVAVLHTGASHGPRRRMCAVALPAGGHERGCGHAGRAGPAGRRGRGARGASLVTRRTRQRAQALRDLAGRGRDLAGRGADLGS
eukprot:scaffold68932_cov45-Phaeocystis_antarctica.AAC.2